VRVFAANVKDKIYRQAVTAAGMVHGARAEALHGTWRAVPHAVAAE
jgi:hypothetical protein